MVCASKNPAHARHRATGMADYPANGSPVRRSRVLSSGRRGLEGGVGYGGRTQISRNSGPKLQDDVKLLSEDELGLIHALQLQPRASWTDLGRALGVDPVTVARRWGRLTERGEAWVNLSAGPRLFEQICTAFVEIDCVATAGAAVADALVSHPYVLTLERTAGAHAFLATVATRDLAAMSRYTLDVLPTVPGVTAVRTRLVTHMFTEAGHWRIAALGPAQQARLTALGHPAPAQHAHEFTAFDQSLMAQLAYDGRASHQALADALATSASTVKRRLDRLTRLGLLRFRCDFARPLGGWPVTVTFWATVPPADLPNVGHALVRLPETRNCAATSGPHNLILQACLHSVEDVLRIEQHVATTHPGIEIAERAVTLRCHKLQGHVLDSHGRSVAVVPPHVWSDPAHIGH